ncbi:MAG: hypothetical protein R2712_29760 [Vicinamibacterales bacterium]
MSPVLLHAPPAAAREAVPAARLVPAPTVELSGRVDSNSPAVWEMVDGQPLLHVLTSIDGAPSIAASSRIGRMGAPNRSRSFPPRARPLDGGRRR